jgi:hypothetical protein
LIALLSFAGRELATAAQRAGIGVRPRCWQSPSPLQRALEHCAAHVRKGGADR